MKRCLSILFALGLLLTLAACAAEPVATEPPAPEPAPVVEPPAPPEPFPGKIAIITAAYDEEKASAKQLVDKYGVDKVIHKTLPDNYPGQDQEEVIKLVEQIAVDPEIKALIINPAFGNMLGEVENLRKTRQDMFVVFCSPPDQPAAITATANLILDVDYSAMGPAMAQQAYNMGAKTFVYYSDLRHMFYPKLSAQRDLVEERCAELGMEFIYTESPDSMGCDGHEVEMQFIYDDVPKMVDKYGKDTAFFGIATFTEIALIKAVVEQGAIFPQPYNPSPFQGFGHALEITLHEYEPDYWDDDIAKITRILDGKGVLGRLSTWPVPSSMLAINAGVEYAIKWLNSEVPEKGIDVDALKQLMENYAGVECFIQPYTDDDGVEYSNYLLVMEDYITFGEEYFKPEASIPSAKVAAEWPSDFWVKDGVLLEYIGNDTDIVLLSGLFSIADEVFAYCYNMQTITIPNTVGSIGRGAFLGCSSLQSLVLPQGITKIRSRTFEGCSSLASINIPNSVTDIEWGMFYGCTSLQSVIIPNSVTEIDWDTFSGCTSLQSVTIPNSVSIIRWGAFENCTNLQSITIPANVTFIEGYAFNNCPNLTIHCPAGSQAEKYARMRGIPYVIE